MTVMDLTRSRRALLPFLVIALFALTPVPVAAQSKAEVDRTAAARDEAYARLVEINAQLDQAIVDYQAVNSELEDLTWRITQLFDRITDYETEVRDLRDRARSLVIEAYMSGGADLITVAFEAGSIQDILTSQELINRATDHDLVALDRLDAVRREMDRLRGTLEIDQERVAELRLQAEEVVVRLDTLQAAANTEYARADDAARAARAKYEAEQQRRRLAELARKQGAAGGVSASVTPGFQCPLPGASFINDWGFPRSGGRRHKGTDMFAPRGTPVLATGAGTVRLKSNSLGGIVAFVNADHGVTYYYAHLNGYAEGLQSGQRVTKGQVVGYVGNTGNAIGSSPHLHFEVHPGGGAAVNPYPTLARSC